MPMPSIPADTTAEAMRVQLDVYRRMAPQQCLEMACRMSDSARRLSAAGVRARHPEYDERKVELAVIRLMLGEELFRTAFPNEDVVP